MKTDKYKALSAAIRAALDESAPMEATEDGGTCNSDSPMIYLPRWNIEKTLNAIKAGGSHGWQYRAGMYVISPMSSGQGNRRTNRAEAMRDALKRSGYDVYMYYRMD